MAVLPCPLDRICRVNGRSRTILLLALIAAILLPAQSRVIRSAATTGNDGDDDEFEVDSDAMSSSVVDSADAGNSWERARRSSGRNDYPTGRRRMHVEVATAAPTGGQDGSLSLETWQDRERSRQTRLFQIQTQVMNALKLPQRPNVIGRNNFTEEEIEAILAAHENNASSSSPSSAESSESADDVIRLPHGGFRPVGKPQPVATVVRRRRPIPPPAPAARQPQQLYPGDVNRRTYVLVPTCTIPSRLKSDRYFTLGGANSALRLYFDTDTLAAGRVRRHGNRRQETSEEPEVEAASLRIFWRGYNAAEVSDSQQQQQQPRKRSRNSGPPAINTTTTTHVANVPAPVFLPPDMSRSPVPDRRQVRGEDLRRRGNREPRGTKGRKQRILDDLGESSAVEILVYQLSKRALSRSGGRGQGHVRQRDNDTQMHGQEDDVSRRPLTQMILRHDDIFTAKWLNVDVTSAVDYWLRHPKRNYGLQVVVNALKSGPDGRQQRGRNGQRRSPQRRDGLRQASSVDPAMVLHGFDCTFYGAKGNSARGRQSSAASGNRRRTANAVASGDLSNGSRARSGVASAVPVPTTPSPRTVAAAASSTPAKAAPAAAYPNLDVILVLPTSADRSQPSSTRRRGGRRNQGDN